MTKIYHTCGKIIPVKLSTVQQQTNSVDCGVFAQHMPEFCYSNFPAGKDLAFNVNEMRDHLVHCLTKQQLLPFPRQKNRKSLKLRINTSIIVNIEKYCSAKCDLPNLFDNMVSCSQCSCREKFNHHDYGKDNIKVVLYDDGMEVDSDSFHCIDPNTSIMILQGNEIWSPPLPPLNDTPPNVDIGRISVVPNLHLELAGNVGYERYQFKCNFETAKQLDIYYQVMWYINDIFHVLKTVQTEKCRRSCVKRK
ncbi:unnamed protein product [Mytilus edulis]|uniref:CIDE-N domain-containing protein n=1 Tax=Mytilus edulis TaxID=6550 RepID=A0A8S3VFH5_MYTED|nr:unnamed protein product [Mytilus edulis]